MTRVSGAGRVRSVHRRSLENHPRMHPSYARGTLSTPLPHTDLYLGLSLVMDLNFVISAALSRKV